jgi:hypothetical protein
MTEQQTSAQSQVKNFMSDPDKVENMLKWLSIGALIIGGAIFIYEGIRYKKMKDKNPNLPNKLYGAASAALILGILSVSFGIIHIWY